MKAIDVYRKRLLRNVGFTYLKEKPCFLFPLCEFGTLSEKRTVRDALERRFPLNARNRGLRFLQANFPFPASRPDRGFFDIREYVLRTAQVPSLGHSGGEGFHNIFSALEEGEPL